jgi:hypothetical protein
MQKAGNFRANDAFRNFLRVCLILAISDLLLDLIDPLRPKFVTRAGQFRDFLQF